MTARSPMGGAPPEQLELADATDLHREFASETKDSPPELVSLGDSTDELDAFSAGPDRSGSSIEAPARRADRARSSIVIDGTTRTPSVNPVGTGPAGRESHPSRRHWMRRASRAALICSVLAAAAGGVLVLRTPAAPPSAVGPPEPAVDAPAIDHPVELAGRTPLSRVDPALAPVVGDSPSVPPVGLPSAPVGSSRVEATTQNSYVRTVPNVTPPSGPRADVVPTPAARLRGFEPSEAPVRARDTPAESTAAVAGSRSLPTNSAAAAILSPDAATSAGTAPPAVGVLPVVPGPSASASSPPGPSRSASTDVSLEAVAGPPGRELETRAIENVLNRYRNAFNRLDAGAASAVWPTVNEKTLARAFERLEDQNVLFESCQIEIGAVLAEAACSGSARYVPKVGSRTPKEEARRWRFSLRKASGGWLIDRVDAR